MDSDKVEEELVKVKRSMDVINRTIHRSHGEIGLGVLLAVTFTFANGLIASKVWEQTPPWVQLTWYNAFVTLLIALWMITLLYVIITRWRRRKEVTWKKGSKST